MCVCVCVGGGGGGAGRLDLKLGYSRKNPNGVQAFLKPLLPSWSFSFFYFTPGNSRQNKAVQPFIPQNCGKLDPLPFGNSKATNKDPLETPNYFILVTLRNYTALLRNPCKFHKLPLLIPLLREIPYPQLNPPVWIFSRIAQLRMGGGGERVIK